MKNYSPSNDQGGIQLPVARVKVRCPENSRLQRLTARSFFSAAKAAVSIPCIAGLIFVVSVVDADARRRDRDRPWHEGASEVKVWTYPDSFRDSLREANDIGPNIALRNYQKYPFQKREKLVFVGGWGFISAGFGIMEAHPTKENPNVLSIGAKGFTNRFVSAFKKVRDYAHARVDANGFYPLFFEQHLHEEDYRDHRWTIYDHQKGRVFTQKTQDSSTDASAFTHNLLSLLYYIRTMDYAPGDSFTVMCFVHEKDYPLHFNVLKREKIEVPAGDFTCLKLKPRLVGDGRGFTKRDEMYIWVTDDEHHMPVLVKAKAKLGHLWAELIHYERD
ncbi:MAG: DUF3108 domain-containing protein [Chitinivibrionales bacterium]|nr:DUF3108 domain-containing protein [Chitinivibrionales bacterium]MBD3355550.1 DUF3108 domain-containing protein [Chitinivibrionales bacterium]